MVAIIGIGNKVAEDNNFDFKEVIFSDGSTGLLGLPARPDCSQCLASSRKYDSLNGSVQVVATFNSRNINGACNYHAGVVPPCVHVSKCTFDMNLTLAVSGIPQGGFGAMFGERNVFLGRVDNGFYNWGAVKRVECGIDSSIFFFIDFYNAQGVLIGDYFCKIHTNCNECVEISIPD